METVTDKLEADGFGNDIVAQKGYKRKENKQEIRDA